MCCIKKESKKVFVAQNWTFRDPWSQRWACAWEESVSPAWLVPSVLSACDTANIILCINFKRMDIKWRWSLKCNGRATTHQYEGIITLDAIPWQELCNQFDSWVQYLCTCKKLNFDWLCVEWDDISLFATQQGMQLSVYQRKRSLAFFFKNENWTEDFGHYGSTTLNSPCAVKVLH